jgi:hypothetical protein
MDPDPGPLDVRLAAIILTSSELLSALPLGLIVGNRVWGAVARAHGLGTDAAAPARALVELPAVILRAAVLTWEVAVALQALRLARL